MREFLGACPRSAANMSDRLRVPPNHPNSARDSSFSIVHSLHHRGEGVLVCSDHFISGKMPLDRDSSEFVPSISPRKRRIKKPQRNADFVPSVSRRDKKNKQCKTNGAPNKRKKLASHNPEATNNSSTTLLGKMSLDHDSPDYVPSVSLFPKDKKKTDGAPNKRKKLASHNPEATNNSSTTLLAGEDIEFEWPDLVDLSIQHRQLQDAYTELQAEVDALSARNARLKEDFHRVLPRFSYASVKGDDEQLLFLTGVRTPVFDWLVAQVADKIEVLPELTSRNHLTMVLMKLKLGLCDVDLAYRFGIRESSVTRMCQTWLPALAATLKPIVAWPSTQTVSTSRPGFFTGKFRRCRCIVDCPEFVVARIGEDKDKHESTVKYFASVTPAGAVSFLSSGYSSLTPERRIIKESGFVRLLDPQDDIMANRQIPIRDELASLQAALHIPDPNNGKQTQKGASGKRLCQVWTHVKKVIGWWKEFNMLQKVIQEPYADLLDEVLIVCAVLTNVNVSLAPKGGDQP
uniref:DDE Tnp4 domain-containing protein n=2 Tax=Neogobius melanostomus TaxID=47308 RepID=A0A8C6S9D3_9GOBI